MAGHELAVEQAEISRAKASDEPRKRDLRSIGGPTEHRLAEKGASELHAIKAADKLFTKPAFDRMGVADGMQAQRRPLDDIVDPCFVAVCAGEHDLVERCVTRHPKFS